RDGRTPDPDRAPVRRHSEGHPAGSADRRRPRDSVRPLAVTLAIAALTLSAVACGPKAPDYKSIWTTSSTTTTTDTATGKPVPLSKYLESIGVSGQQVAPGTLTDLTVSIPTPPGWSPFSNPNITPETVIISKGNSYPTARLVVFKLRGDFDPVQ